MIVHDRVTGGKADADPFTDRLGGEKRFKQLILHLQRDAAAIILNDQRHAVVLLDLGLDQDDAAGLGGVDGIGQQINDHLLELRLVAEDGREMVLKFGFDDEVVMFFEVVFEDEQGVGDALVEVDLTDAGDGRATEGQQGLDDITAAQAFLDDGFGIFLEIGVEFFVDCPLELGVPTFKPWANPRMAVSGLLISWATPAARVPTVAIFSA